MHRHELDDRQLATIEDLFPRQSGRGRPRKDDRQMLNAILWVLHSGAPWRDLPERYGPWQSVYARYTKWRRDGRFARLRTKLQVDLDRIGAIDWSLWCVDGSSIRAVKAAAGAGKRGASRSRRTTR